MASLIDVTPGSPEWLAARRAGVTATDIVTILGLSSHDSVYSLFWRKLGQVPDEPDRDRWQLGRHLEPYIAGRWAEGSLGIHEGGLWRSDQRTWQLATPDRLANALAGPRGVPLECKSWADADKKSWESGPPAAVRAQLLWQMDTLDAAAGYWAVVFLPSGRFEHGEIEHDPDATEHTANPFVGSAPCTVCTDQVLMRSAGEEFYRRLILELDPPNLDNSAATLAALRARFTRTEGKQAEVDQTTYAAWSDAKDCERSFANLARGYEIQLRDQAGKADVLTVDGQAVAKRIVADSPVKAHTRHMDYYRRVKQKDGDDE